MSVLRIQRLGMILGGVSCFLSSPTSNSFKCFASTHLISLTALSLHYDVDRQTANRAGNRAVGVHCEYLEIYLDIFLQELMFHL